VTKKVVGVFVRFRAPLMLVYNIKRSINMGMSDLIAKLKNGAPPTSKACFAFLTNYFRLYKDSIK
jgi:hypothetical protein